MTQIVNMDYSPLWISLKTACIATIVTFFAGITAARWILGYKGRFRIIADGLLTLPMVLPPTVAGFFLLVVMGRNGPIGRLLAMFGRDQVVFSWPAAVIAAAFVSFPLMYKAACGAFEQVDPNIIHAARTLGISEAKVFWRVSVPLAWPGIAAGTVLTFLRALGEFGATMMVAGNIPGKTQTIPIAIFFEAQGDGMPRALVWVVLIFALSLGMMMLINLKNKGCGGRMLLNAYGRRG